MINFGAACTDLFKTEKKWITILGLSLCTIIPIVGQMVATGYTMRRLARERLGNPAEDFDFDFFGDYLKMGVWPVLAQIVAALIFMPIMMIIFSLFIPFIAKFEDGGGEDAGAILALILAGLGIAIFLLSIFMSVYCAVVLFQAGLKLHFSGGFTWKFIKSFFGKVGLKFLGFVLLLILLSLPIIGVSYVTVVGVYVASAWMAFALLHLTYQHYDEMVEKGGEAIEVNPELVKPLGLPPTQQAPLPPASGPAT